MSKFENSVPSQPPEDVLLQNVGAGGEQSETEEDVEDARPKIGVLGTEAAEAHRE